jgi:hypothetical protein
MCRATPAYLFGKWVCDVCLFGLFGVVECAVFAAALASSVALGGVCGFVWGVLCLWWVCVVCLLCRLVRLVSSAF